MKTNFSQRNNGFTLLELLISITILSIMTGIYVVQLSQASEANERMQKRSDELKSLQVFFNRLSQDLEHIVERPVRGEIDTKPAILGVDGRLELTRSAWPNPMLLIQRSSIKRIGYEFREGGVYRQIWGYLDQGDSVLGNDDAGANAEQELLSGINSMTFEYLIQDPDDLNFEWQEEWPENASFGAAVSLEQAMPLVLKVTIDIENMGEIYRFFSIPENRFRFQNTNPENPNSQNLNFTGSAT